MEIFEDFLKQIEGLTDKELEDVKNNYDAIFDNLSENNQLINEIREGLIEDHIKENQLFSLKESLIAYCEELLAKEESTIKKELITKVKDKAILVLDEILTFGLAPIISCKIQLINENAVVPEYAHPSDAGMDLYSPEDHIVKAKETKIIPLGFKVVIPQGYELQVRPRSGMSAKTKIRVANAPGTIDSGFRGECGVILDNLGETDYEIKRGDRIAQFVLSKVPKMSFKIIDDIEHYNSDRSEGGFGSTGK